MPQKSGKEITRHPSKPHDGKGRLERGGNYSRLDYFHADSRRKDCGTIPPEHNSKGKPWGHFPSQEPISRGIANGKYAFTDKGKQAPASQIEGRIAAAFTRFTNATVACHFTSDRNTNGRQGKAESG